MKVHIVLVISTFLLGLLYAFCYETVDYVPMCKHYGRVSYVGCCRETYEKARLVACSQLGIAPGDGVEVLRELYVRKHKYGWLPPRLEASCLLGEPFYIGSKELAFRASIVDHAFFYQWNDPRAGSHCAPEEPIFRIFNPSRLHLQHLNVESPSSFAEQVLTWVRKDFSSVSTGMKTDNASCQGAAQE